ncbi:GGDEF domain-containing protein [Salinibacterium sp. dk2585]|uniref:GGDEF domain-containing protein n=1 Tax=unclassified Salinibacterium TaxID=2632331 RepID=UPI0011C24685|nr:MULTISPECIES: GGDEF domain-containing protein [unclassified Salinibacterium]QEE62314.1 GGDEF domain-containing protein [Salinibacterium sp. dk2585]TXK53665.1 GGDEF domain-containing protein [Salinibacterium sp. dk5596]
MSELSRPGESRPLLNARLLGLSGPVWSMMLVLGAGVLLLVFGLVFPAHSAHNVPLKVCAALVGLALLAVLLTLRNRTPMWVLWGELLFIVAMTGLLINGSPTDAGGVSLMLGLIAAAVYAGFWGDRVMSAAMVAVMLTTGTSAIFANDRFTTSLGSAWVMAAGLIVGLVFVLQVLVAGLQQQALIDPLTGVMNRRGLQALTQVRQASGRGVLHRSIALIDIDDFKRINDDLGHAEGDRVLRALAEHWVTGLRSDDIVVRLGGDEFVIVFSRVDADAAEALMARLAERSPAPWTYGLAPWPDGADFDGCLLAADVSLLEKKRARGAARS